MPANKKNLVVLGAGTAGTMVVNKLRKKLNKDEWNITIVDSSTTHHYQPGFLFLPFGTYSADDIVKPKRKFIPNGVDFRVAEIEKVMPEENQVLLANGEKLPYDQLVIATGTTPRPDQTEGMDGPQFHDTVHEFYSFEGSKAGRQAGDSHHRDADQVPRRASRIHVPGRRLLQAKGHSRQG